jgi:hypothetical protein
MALIVQRDLSSQSDFAIKDFYEILQLLGRRGLAMGATRHTHQIKVGQATAPAEVHRATPPGELCKRGRLQDYASRVGWPTAVRGHGCAHRPGRLE